jgi:Protein of unknown function (DUF998)
MKAPLPIRWLAIAGVIGPLFFIALVVAQGMLQPDYSHIAMPISALAAWPAGWMQNLNFFLLGTLNAAFTVGLHNAIRATRFGLIGILLTSELPRYPYRGPLSLDQSEWRTDRDAPAYRRRGPYIFWR